MKTLDYVAGAIALVLIYLVAVVVAFCLISP